MRRAIILMTVLLYLSFDFKQTLLYAKVVLDWGRKTELDNVEYNYCIFDLSIFTLIFGI